MGNTELDFFIKTISSTFARVRNGSITLTNFLDEERQTLLLKMKPSDIHVLMDGGFKNAEHKRCFIYGESIQSFQFKIKVFELVYNSRYLTVTHRKLLGALLGLGLKRECIGDIFIKENKVYFACTEEISSYIVANLTTLQGIPVELKNCTDTIEIEHTLANQTYTVSSMRLDVILASAYHLSRTVASSMIQDGLVQIQHEVCQNSSKILKENDIISVRHKGRFKIQRILGKTKSDRIKLELGFWM